MDPNNPRPPQQRGKGMELGQVQRWVLSIVALGVVGLHSAAMAAAPLAFNSGVAGAKPALLIISGIFGMMAVVAALVIHKKSPFSPLLIFGWVPAVIFFFIYF